MSSKLKSIMFLNFIIFHFITTLYANNTSVGDTISQFMANDDNGNLWKLTDNLDKEFLVIYFYPAAMTGG